MEVCGERRRGDRRKNPPFTWQAGDFVVVPTEETTTTRTRD